jgi:hypothetical protein
MKRFLTLLALIVPLCGTVDARADTTADCGRFYLKYDPNTRTMKCVNGKRNVGSASANIGSLAQDFQRAVRILQKVLDGAEAAIRTRDQLQKQLDGKPAKQRTEQQIQEVEQRVRELLNQVEQRSRDVQQKAQELAQAQRQRSQELASEQRQAVQAQV